MSGVSPTVKTQQQLYDAIGSELYTTPNADVISDIVASIPSLGGGGIASLLGSSVTKTILDGDIDITAEIAAGVHYILLEGEGSADDELRNILGTAPDGYMLLIEQGPSGNDITLDTGLGTNYEFNNKEVNEWHLGPSLYQMWAQWSDDKSEWIIWHLGVGDILSPDGQTEIIASDGTLYFAVSGDEAASATGGAWALKFPLIQKWEQITLASDKLTGVVSGVLEVDTEGGAASDDCVSIEIAYNSGFGSAGTVLYVYPASDARTVVLKHNNAGGTVGFKFFCAGGTDITLDDQSDFATLIYNPSLASGAGGWMAKL